MTTRKHALLLFSKPPLPGEVKTRLTREKGGPFSEEEAAEIFRRTMFDVSELCCLALYEMEQESKAEVAANPAAAPKSYDFFVSTTPVENVEIIKHTFEEIGEWPRHFTYIADRGRSYDEHLQDAFQQIFDLEYDSVLYVSPDAPLLPREHVLNGLRWLDYFGQTSSVGGVVQATTQDGDVCLIGWTRNADIDHLDVTSDQRGRPPLDIYLGKAADKGIPLITLPPVLGFDDINDFAQTVTQARALRYSQKYQPDLYLPIRFLDWVDWRGIKVGNPPA
ncbi:MAG: DUF2064 domain-containing protein [Coriobacteriales bacterium]|nr:DUF2064 domain-containing protein [Coriobacteriales bacterium]